MGYDTEITGKFNLDKQLTAEHKKFLKDFADESHYGKDKAYPGLWCQWVPTEDGMGIEHDGGEKFYEYTEWLQYLVKNFLGPWGYVLNGNVSWKGENYDDIGKIWVKNNVVKAVFTKLIADEPDWGMDVPEPLDEVDPAANCIDEIVEGMLEDEDDK